MRKLVILVLGLAALIHGGAAFRAQQTATEQPPEKAAPEIPPGYRIVGKVKAPKLVHKVSPDYPPEAKRQGLQGTVRLEVIIGRDGKVRELKVLDGNPLLVDAAAKAVRKWRWKLNKFRGEVLEVRMKIDVNFKLP